MKGLLFDESVDFRIVKGLRRSNYEVFSIMEDSPGIDDNGVLEYADKKNTVLITEDKDFGDECPFWARICTLLLRKELDRRLDLAGYNYEWFSIKQDLKALEEFILKENGQSISVRSEYQGVCANIFKAVGIAIPPTIRML